MTSKACVGLLLALFAFSSYLSAAKDFRNSSGWSDCYAAENIIKTVHVKSSIHCAMRCSQQGCAVYNINGEMCEMIFDANSAPSSSTLYRGLLPASALASKEVARGRPATGSPQYSTAGPSLITDGNHASNYHSADNGAVVKPYLLVDLQGLRFVEKIRVLPVAEGHAHRFRDVQILLGNTPTTGDFSNYTVVATFAGPLDWSQGWLEFDVTPPRCSRYVGIYKYVEYPYDLYLLEVREVEVIARSY